MCVIFWSENSEVEILHVFDAISYRPEKREIVSNVSLVISNPSAKDADIGVVHRQAVKMVPATNRWHRQTNSNKHENELVDYVSRIYNCSFDNQNGSQTVTFDEKKSRQILKDIPIASDKAQILALDRAQPTGQKSKTLPLTKEKPAQVLYQGPYTVRLIKGIPAHTEKLLYSFDVIVNQKAYDTMMTQYIERRIEGASILRSRILNKDIVLWPHFTLEQQSEWHNYFENTIWKNSIKPLKYDVLITNTQGTLPNCYRLCYHTQREFINNQELKDKVVWFISDDQNGDFIIEVDFDNPQESVSPDTEDHDTSIPIISVPGKITEQADIGNSANRTYSPQ